MKEVADVKGLISPILSIIILLLSMMTCAAAKDVIVDDFNQGSPGLWTFSNGPEFPGANGKLTLESAAAESGKYGGKLSYDFTKGGAYVEASIELPKAENCSGIRLFIRNVNQTPLAVRVVDSDGQCFQKFFNISHGSWQQVFIRLSGWEGSWGGASDGVFRGSPTRFGLLARPGSVKRGSLYFDNVALVTEGSSSTMETKSPVCTIPGFDKTIKFKVDNKDREGISGDVSIPGSPTKLYVTVVSRSKDYSVNAVLGSHFQSFQKTLGKLDGSGEQTFEVPLGDMREWKHDGGENDGVVRLPLRLRNISIIKDQGPAEGEVTIKSVKAETKVSPDHRVVLNPTGQVQGTKALFSCDLQSILTEDVKGKLVCRFTDYAGSEIGVERVDAVLAAGGVQKVEISKNLDGKNFIECEFSFETRDRSYGPVSTCAVSLPASPGDSALVPQSPFGIGVYLYRYRDNDELMQKAAGLAMRAGVKWSREEMLWHLIEPEKGKFDWSFYDKVVETAYSHGISVYGLIDYWSEWTKPYTKEGIEDYARYCRTLVSHYKDRIKHWEIWNEPNIFFWSGPKELYPELLKAAYKAIKEADPEAKVLGCSTAGVDHAFIKQVMDAGAPFDDLTIHPYRGELNDEGFIKELKDTAKLVDSKPIWITEMGWPTQLQGGVSEREQAKLIARTYLSSIASDTVVSVSWYDFREDGSNPFYNEHKFGIVRHFDLAPKPAYRALATLGNAIGSKPVTGRSDLGQGIMAYQFGKDKDSVTAVWSTGDTAILAIPAKIGKLNAVNLMGEQIKPASHNGQSFIALERENPILLQGFKIDPAAVKVIRLEHPRAAVPGSSMTLVLKNASSISGLDAEITGTENIKVASRKMEKGDIEYKVSIPSQTPAGPVTLRLQIGEGRNAFSIPVRIDITEEVMRI